MSEETKKMAAERDAKMAQKGFVPVAEAARLVSMPRTNIYHWVRSGELRQERWGTVGRNSVYVSLDDLKRKVPQAFPAAKKAADAQAPTPRPLRRDRRKRAAA